MANKHQMTLSGQKQKTNVMAEREKLLHVFLFTFFFFFSHVNILFRTKTQWQCNEKPFVKLHYTEGHRLAIQLMQKKLIQLNWDLCFLSVSSEARQAGKLRDGKAADSEIFLSHARWFSSKSFCGQVEKRFTKVINWWLQVEDRHITMSLSLDFLQLFSSPSPNETQTKKTKTKRIERKKKKKI